MLKLPESGVCEQKFLYTEMAKICLVVLEWFRCLCSDFVKIQFRFP